MPRSEKYSFTASWPPIQSKSKNIFNTYYPSVFNPNPLFTVSTQQLVNFSGCQLEEPLPAGATLRVTAKVQIYGRIKGDAKHADGWYWSRK